MSFSGGYPGSLSATHVANYLARPHKLAVPQSCYYEGISPYNAMCIIQYFAKHELGGISYGKYAFVNLKIAQSWRKRPIYTPIRADSVPPAGCEVIFKRGFPLAKKGFLTESWP